MSENENTGTPVSNTPWIDPERDVHLTEEPQAETNWNAQHLPSGHLRVLSAPGIGERPHGDVKAKRVGEVEKPAKKTAAKKTASKAKSKGN